MQYVAPMRTVELSDVIEVNTDQAKGKFSRKQLPQYDNTCFSIVHTDGSLDLACKVRWSHTFFFVSFVLLLENWLIQLKSDNVKMRCYCRTRLSFLCGPMVSTFYFE
jgi:hypothetical protein